MAEMVKKSFDAPEETRSLHKGKIEVVDLGGLKVKRVIHEPGWRWSECVKPAVGTDSCQVGHLIHVISGLRKASIYAPFVADFLAKLPMAP